MLILLEQGLALSFGDVGCLEKSVVVLEPQSL